MAVTAWNPVLWREQWPYLNDALPELGQLLAGLKPEEIVAIEWASHPGPHEGLAARR